MSTCRVLYLGPIDILHDYTMMTLDKPACNVKAKLDSRHSISVPTIYRNAKKILQQHLEGKGSIKKLIYAGKYKPQDYQKITVIVMKAIMKYDKIQTLLNELGIFDCHPSLNPYMATILASEAVERRDDLPGRSKPILTINTYRRQLIDKLHKAENNKAEFLPTYIRINTLKTSFEKIHEELVKLGYKFIGYDWKNYTYQKYLEIIQDLDEISYVNDFHIPQLLVFHSRRQFWSTQILKDNLIIVQDKASCLPAFLSGVYPGMKVIDACAAPGNKTTHLASLMENKGTLIAVDKTNDRFELLERMIDERGATFVNTINEDFTDLDKDQFDSTQLILVDPSCSSSGTTFHREKISNDRIAKLAYFQSRVLQHALSFPHVETVLYSTCSVNEEENEAVVEEALKLFKDRFKLSNLKKQLREWKHFGLPKYECGKFCIRTEPSFDCCHGFFVAKFIRKGNKSESASRVVKNKKKSKDGEGSVNCVSNKNYSKVSVTKKKKKKVRPTKIS